MGTKPLPEVLLAAPIIRFPEDPTFSLKGEALMAGLPWEQEKGTETPKEMRGLKATAPVVTGYVPPSVSWKDIPAPYFLKL